MQAVGDLNKYRDLFNALGGTLFGSSAIVFSILVFAVQAAIEKLPASRIKEIARDGFLLSATLFAFANSLIIFCFGIVVDSNTYNCMFALSMFMAIINIALYIFSFYRGSGLIDPNDWAKHALTGYRKKIEKIEKEIRVYIKTYKKLIEKQKLESDFNEKEYLDLIKYRFFIEYPHSIDILINDINILIHYLKKLNFSGENQLVQQNLDCLLLMNQDYLNLKAGAFVSESLFDTSITVPQDKFINFILEEIRKLADEAIAAKDENMLNAIINTMGTLVSKYSTIEYQSKSMYKEHVNLAQYYLHEIIKKCIPLNNNELIFKAVNVVGKYASISVQTLPEESIKIAIEFLKDLTLETLNEPQYGVILGKACHHIERISTILIFLALGSSRNIKICNEASTMLLLKSSIRQLTNPKQKLIWEDECKYFSNIGLINTNAINLASILNKKFEENEELTRKIISKFSEFLDSLYQNIREMLPLLMTAKSSYIFSLVPWIFDIAKAANVFAMHQLTPNNIRDDLLKKSNFLVYSLTWVEFKQDSITHLEIASFSDLCFELVNFMYTIQSEDQSDYLKFICKLIAKMKSEQYETRLFYELIIGVIIIKRKYHKSITANELATNFKLNSDKPELDKTEINIEKISLQIVEHFRLIKSSQHRKLSNYISEGYENFEDEINKLVNAIFR